MFLDNIKSCYVQQVDQIVIIPMPHVVIGPLLRSSCPSYHCSREALKTCSSNFTLNFGQQRKRLRAYGNAIIELK